MKRYIVALIFVYTAMMSMAANTDNLSDGVITSQRFTILNGLPDNNIRCMAQDDDGFLWLGTLYGLYRYDGYSCRKYLRQAEGNRSLLATNRVKWIKNIGHGILRLRFNIDEMVDYDIRHDLFKPFPGAKKYLAQDKEMRRRDIFQDDKGNMVSYDRHGGISFTDSKTGRRYSLQVVSEKMANTFADLKISMLTDRRGLIWVSSNGGGLLIFNPKTGEQRRITSESGLIPSDYIVSMIADDDDDIWVSSTWNGLTKLHFDRSRYFWMPVGTNSANDDEVKALVQFRDGTLVMANNRGRVFGCSLPEGAIYNSIGELPGSGLWATTTKHGVWLRDHFVLDGERTDRILIDSKGRLWVTSVNGLFAEAPLQALLDADAGQSRSGSAMMRRFFTEQKYFDVRAVMQASDGNIFIGTAIGLISFNPDEFLRNPKKYTLYPLKKTTEGVRVNAIYEDAHHDIWVGTIANGVFRGQRGKDSKMEFTEMGQGFVPNNSIAGFVEDRHGNLWIGTENGMSCYNLKSGKNRYFSVETNDRLNHTNANCMCLLRNGKIAFGTIGGLVILDENSIPPMWKQHVVRITDFFVNGQNICEMPDDDNPLPHQSITDAREIRLPYNESSIAIHFSNMLYNTNGVTRYRYWLEGLETEWNEPTTANSASYQNLKPGRYIFHIDGFFDGDRTTEQQLVIVIEEPWWNTWWAYLFYIIAVAIAVAIVYNEAKQKYQLRKEAHDERMLSDFRIKFFTNISHEFRTPLTLILSSVDRLQNLKGLNGETKDSIESMRHSTERMKRLIDQLLEFRKMEEGKLQLRVQKTDACAFVYKIWQQFHDVSENRNISYQFLSSKKKIPCYLDRGYMDKIIYNLLSNAFKYTSLNGEITIEVSQKSDGMSSLVIRVTDNGVGVPENRREGLFNSTVKSSVVGDSVGIGLKLSAELIHKHHGEIWYEPGRDSGSVFSISIPMDEEAYSEDERMAENAVSHSATEDEEYAQVYPQQKSIELSSEPLNDKTVLIVEDDYDVLSLLQRELQQYFHVIIASNGEEAVEYLENTQVPDLVITDYLMPKMNGMELLQHIRKSAYRYIPVIMLTAIDAENTKLRGMQLGADAYVTKPFSMPLLVAQCINLIKQRSYMLVATGQEAVDGGAAAKAAAEANKLRLPEIISEERDKKLIDQMDMYIEAHIGNSDLNVDTMAEALGYRRTNFYKKITALLGCSPKEYVRRRRIERVADMLQDDRYTVSEIAYKLGYSNPQYMSSVFKAYYGVRPSEYKKGT